MLYRVAEEGVSRTYEGTYVTTCYKPVKLRVFHAWPFDLWVNGVKIGGRYNPKTTYSFEI